jgi:uncharacterized membrane protein YfcA
MPIDPLSAFFLFVAVGFAAQLVDGALGMAYGVITTSVLLALGVPPAQASALVHAAEIFTTGASGAAHAWKRNVDWRLVARLAPAGALGGVAGAWAVSVAPVAIIRPAVAAWLGLMGLVLIVSALVGRKPAERAPKHVAPLGLVGGFLDASGGGGWGPVVSTTLLSAGHTPHTTIGSVSLSEFFVTVAITATFAMTLGTGHLMDVAGLVVGGVLAAPLAAHAVRIIPARVLMALVGAIVIGLSGLQLSMALQSAWAELWSLTPPWAKDLLVGR